MKRNGGRREAGLRANAGTHLDLAPPRGLRAHRFDVGPDAFVILEIPLRSPSAPPPCESLTDSERSVMRLMLEGQSNQQIAGVRRTAVRTVANQVASIFKKLGVGSRAELYALAVRGGKPAP